MSKGKALGRQIANMARRKEKSKIDHDPNVRWIGYGKDGVKGKKK